MDRKKMLFVYNPRAGKAQIRSKLADILDIFAGAGYEILICPTRQKGDAVKLVEQRPDDIDVVVCSGGDGTLDETVTGLIRSEKRSILGYIPAGSTNDFGASLALPKDMIKAAHIIVEGRTFGCDVGTFNDDVFVYIAAFGLFTEVSYDTDQELKNLIGHSAYILEGAKSLVKIHSSYMKVTYDGGFVEGSFLYGMITNSTSVGGFRGITGKEVALDDGEFEVMLIREPKNVLDLNAILLALVNRDIDVDQMITFRTSHLVIESEEEVAWTLDGENGGKHSHVEISNLQKAIDIKVTPPEYADWLLRRAEEEEAKEAEARASEAASEQGNAD